MSWQLSVSNYFFLAAKKGTITVNTLQTVDEGDVKQLLSIAEASEEENLPKFHYDKNLRHEGLRLNQDSGLQSP